MGRATLVRSEDVDALLADGWSVIDTAPPPPQKPLPPVTEADLRRWNPLPAGGKILRLLIPSGSKHAAQTIFGRSYPAPDGPILDAPEGDARALAANGGWMILGQVGTTEQRPSEPRRGDRFFDLWVEAELIFDGATWRHPFTGQEA
jgi:hypothetical protein